MVECVDGCAASCRQRRGFCEAEVRGHAVEPLVVDDAVLLQRAACGVAAECLVYVEFTDVETAVPALIRVQNYFVTDMPDRVGADGNYFSSAVRAGGQAGDGLASWMDRGPYCQ